MLVEELPNEYSMVQTGEGNVFLELITVAADGDKGASTMGGLVNHRMGGC